MSIYPIFIFAILFLAYNNANDDELETFIESKENLNQDWHDDNCIYDKSFKKYIKAWLSDSKYERLKSPLFLQYYDSDSQNSNHPYGYYEDIKINHTYVGPVKISELFKYDGDKLDYKIIIYDSRDDLSSEYLYLCYDVLIKKKWSNITPKEVSQIGNEFQKRVKRIYSSLENFTRFNKEPIDKLLREEYNKYWTGINEETNKIKNTGFSIYKYLDQEQIDKLNEFIASSIE